MRGKKDWLEGGWRERFAEFIGEVLREMGRELGGPAQFVVHTRSRIASDGDVADVVPRPSFLAPIGVRSGVGRWTALTGGSEGVALRLSRSIPAKASTLSPFALLLTLQAVEGRVRLRVEVATGCPTCQRRLRQPLSGK